MVSQRWAIGYGNAKKCSPATVSGERSSTHRRGNRNGAAPAISITAPAETVLDRLEYVVSHFEEYGGSGDQRTGRRWSDQGLKTFTDEMEYAEEVRG